MLMWKIVFLNLLFPPLLQSPDLMYFICNRVIQRIMNSFVVIRATITIDKIK